MMDRSELLQKIDEIGFALYDTALFLDSHPDSRLALDYYRENQQLYRQYRDQYESAYGPLTLFNVNAENGWTWTQGPWPWEVTE